MATLTGKTIASTYTSLLKLEGNSGSTVAGADGNAVQVKTGDNDATPLYLNTDRIGINTAAPDKLLHLYAANSGVTPHANTNLFIEDSANNYLELGVPNGETAGIYFSDVAGTPGSINYNHSSNLMTFSTDSLFSFSGGNVGIGTVSPQENLDIWNNNTTNANCTLRIVNDYNGADSEIKLQAKTDSGGSHYAVLKLDGTTEDFVINMEDTSGAFSILQNGNVGIGTIEPTYALHIKSGHSTDDQTTGGGTLALQGSDTTVGADTDLGTIYFLGSDSSISSPPTVGAKILAEGAGTWDDSSANDAPTNLKFFTCDDNASNTIAQRMVIRHDGKIGIGVTIPNSKLHISKTVNSATFSPFEDLLIENLGDTTDGNATARYTGIGFRTSGGGTAATERVKCWFGAVRSATYGRSDFIFLTDGSADAGSVTTSEEVMRIKAGGNVGIGVSNPQHSLHIATNESIFWGATTEYSRIVSYVGEWNAASSTTHELTLCDDAQDYHVVAMELLVVLRNSANNSGYSWSVRGSFTHGGTLDVATLWEQGTTDIADPVLSDNGGSIILTMTSPVASHTCGYTVQLREVRTS
tara:strand:+ start:9077 stop:10822 length:1746 start_codon:yes stop_codon:yes gene_type:complete